MRAKFKLKWFKAGPVEPTRKRKRLSVDQQLLQSNVERDLVRPTSRRQSTDVLDEKNAEILRLQHQIKKLETEIDNENNENDEDENYDDSQEPHNDYDVRDQLALDFLESMTIKNGAIKLVSVKTLRYV